MKPNPIPNRTLHEGTFLSRDGVEIFYRFWKSPKAGDPLFLIVHGFGEHSLRYDDFLKSLSDKPLSFAAFDLRGHGRSGGERVFVERFENYLSDLDDFLEYLKSNHSAGTSPLFLFGHSLGGQISAYYAITRPSRIQLLMLSSPCIAVQLWIPFAEKLVLFLSQNFPHTVLANPVLPVFLTHDKSEVKQYSSDVLIQRKITLGMVGQMIRATELILERANEVDVPLYILTAGSERIVLKSAARNFFEKVSSRDKKWIEFDGFYHEILKENGKERVYAAVKSILEKHLPAGPS